MHGLWRTSRDFVFTGPEKGLAFLLADRGYDVWLPNARGTPYSMKHIKLNPDKDAKFWKFRLVKFQKVIYKKSNVMFDFQLARDWLLRSTSSV